MLNYVSVIVSILVTAAVAHAQVSLLPAESIPFTTSPRNVPASTLATIDAAGQAFQKAYRISTLGQTGNDRLTMRYTIDSDVQKGDVLLLSFYSRSLQSRKETGESFIEISLDRVIGGKYTWPPLIERGMSFGSVWTLTQIPFVASREVTKGDLSLVIKCGSFPQQFELGQLTLVNYKQSKQLADLPRSIVHYDGDAPDAAWRKAAADRIEKYRKGDLTVRVLNASGKPVNNASVSVRLAKSAFAWGTATNSKMLLDSISPDAKTYRDTLLRYFNKVVFENEMKSKNWATTDHDQTKKAVAWLRTHNIPARGHVMVWPSWQHSPHLVRYQRDKAALGETIMNQIADQTAVMKDQFVEWDVINEPFAHHSIIDSLGGKNVMVSWFNAARKNTPGVKLFLNEYTMFHAEGGGSDSFYNYVKFLKDQHAPIDGIGEQAHIGGTPPGIELVLKRLDRFAEFGLPIQISEFDITSDDDDFKARYMRDFMTALFSHPATTGFVQWGFWEKAHWIPAGALWDKDWNLRAHGKVFTDLVGKTWTTHETGVTRKTGEYKVRGFTGDYDIVVTVNGKSVRKNYTLDRTGGAVEIRLPD
ncbi:endo-1,4-beta-xylanase [Spirosoma fluviale]|uniref:Beta-xylanase n=1 Tax=Spirosoma fluviale TaxID=1597977 RepID=A0A286GUY8_9BACT|nr:endo-1,4-beta-xylanase [Spirosoma fluviale]SOD99311.1 Endo-1,4-beta-xylanase, GH35 family [Spirosoma fluviale]